MVVTEYTAVREGGAGLIDLSPCGRINVSGTEAVPFLNGLITNDVKILELNSWMTAAFPNVQGRLLAAVRVLHTSAGYLLDTETITSGKVLELVKRFTLAGDFQVADLTASTSSISIQGAGSTEVIKALLGEDAAAVKRQHIVEAQSPDGAAVNVIRASHTGEDGFDLFADADSGRTLWDAFAGAGAQPLDPATLEVLRIEAGIPRYGVDMDETSIVLETTLDDAVSFTKGCYLGQEIIARIKHRGHVAKKLTGLRFDGEAGIEAGAKIKSVDGKDIGRVTSATYSPNLGRSVALGYVKYDYLAAGTVVHVISAEEEIPAKVAELPFVRGSWYSN